MSNETEKTEPNTIRALAQDLCRVEAKVDGVESKVDAHTRRHDANVELLLNELQRQGNAIAELSKAVADYHGKLLEHDRWERERAANRERPSSNGGEVLE